MKTVIQIVFLLSLGIAIRALFVSDQFMTGSRTFSKSTALPPVSLIVPLSARSLNNPATLATGENSVPFMARKKTSQNTDRYLDTDEFQTLADQDLEQLYDDIWQVVETDSDDYAKHRKFGPSALDEDQDHASGVILAELIRTAPTTDKQVNALRLLAEASQELWISPSSLELDDSYAGNHQLTKSFFDETTVGGFLDAVAEVVENGNQRERLAALSTLEEMHHFAPIWEVAYSVLYDPDPQIRMRALELLTYGDRQVATDHLLTALSDPNPEISELAEKLLIGLAEAPSQKSIVNHDENQQKTPEGNRKHDDP